MTDIVARLRVDADSRTVIDLTKALQDNVEATKQLTTSMQELVKLSSSFASMSQTASKAHKDAAIAAQQATQATQQQAQATQGETEWLIRLNGVQVDLNKNLADQLKARQANAQTAQAGATATREETQAAMEEGRAVAANIAIYNMLTEAQGNATRSQTSHTSAVRMFNSESGLKMKLLPEEASAVARNITLYESLAGGTNRAAGGIHNMWQQSFLFFGVAMMVNSAVQQLAVATGEKANPALMQFGRIMQEVSSGAMIGMMSGAGVAGMGVGALGGLLMGLGLSLFTVDEDIVAVNKQLDSLAKKDVVADTISKITGATREATDAMLKFAKETPEAAIALQRFWDAAKPKSDADKFLLAFQGGWSGIQRISAESPWAKALKQITPTLGENYFDRKFAQDRQDALVKIEDAGIKQVNKMFSDGQKDLADSANEGLLRRGEAFNSYLSDYGDAWKTYITDAQKADDDYAKSYSDYLFQRGQQEERTNAQRAKLEVEGRQIALHQVDSIENQFKERTLTIEQTLADRKSDIAQQQRDREADSLKSLLERQSELDYDFQQKSVTRAQQAARDKDQYAETVAKAARSRDDALDDLRFNTAEQGAKARTYGEYLEVQRRARHEQSVIERRFTEQKNDAQDAMDDATRRTNEQMALDTKEYQHNKDLAFQKYRDAIDVAEREATQQTAIAEREYRQQTDAAKRNYDQQYADAKKRYDDELVQFNLTVQQQNATLNRQHAALLQRQKDAKDAALARYNAELAAADERYKRELQSAELFEKQTYLAFAKRVRDELELMQLMFGALGIDTGGTSDQLAAFQGVVERTQKEINFMRLNPGVPVPQFDRGGIVPGPVGTPQVVVAHGGEEVIKYADRRGDDKPSGKQMSVQFVFQAPIYGVEDLEYTITQALDKYDRDSHVT